MQWYVTTPVTITTDGFEKYTCMRSGCDHTTETRIVHATGTEGLGFANWNIDEYSVEIGTAIGNIFIPSFHNNRPVTRIDNLGFADPSENVTSVIIPASITTMGSNVFRNWTHNQTITVPFATEDDAVMAWGEGWLLNNNAVIVFA